MVYNEGGVGPRTIAEFDMDEAGKDMMDNYNLLMDENKNEFVESFLPCKNSGLINNLQILYESKHRHLSHPVISYCSLSRKPYFTCVTYRPSVVCVSRHVCSFIPVIIGSELDRKIIDFLYPGQKYDDKVIQHLYGMIFIDSAYYFSNLLTNRKELMHRVKRSNLPEVYELFIYDIDERGHKISMDSTGTITYRNRSGRDEIIPCFDKTKDLFMLDGTFLTKREYLMLHHMHEAFWRLSEDHVDIDSLANKNIMSPINILQKAIQYSRRNNTDVAKFMKAGMLEKFASLQISYRPPTNTHNHHSRAKTGVNVDPAKFNMSTSLFATMDESTPSDNVETSTDTTNVGATIVANGGKRKFEAETTVTSALKKNKKKNSKTQMSTSHASFNFKKIQSNQLGTISNTWYRNVVRPIPTNVPRVPIETEFFLCMAEKSMSIDSPNRWMILLDNIFISNQLRNSTLTDINTILETCLYAGFFVQLDRMESVPSDCCVVMVNGGLLTCFAIAANVDMEKLFWYVKSLNPFVEVYTSKRFFMLNLTDGIAFLRINVEPSPGVKQFVHISPLELLTCMKKFRSIRHLAVLGPNCPKDIKDMISYVTPSKLMSIVNLRNRLNNVDCLPLFPLTTDNTCAYIDTIECDIEKKSLYNPIQSFITNTSVMYSSNPQLTLDGYILSDRISSEVKLCKRFSVDFTTDMAKTNIYWPGPEETLEKRTINIYGFMGNVVSRRILVLTIVKYGARLKYKSFPQIRLKIIEKNLSHGIIWSYRIEYWDDTCESLDPNFDLSVICTTTNCRRHEKTVVISVMAHYRDTNFDFKLGEMCGQKGIIVRQDTGRFQRIHNLPSRPHIVSSIFSVIGRSPIIQLKCLVRDNLMTPKPNMIIYGKYFFGVLKNIPASVASANPMRIDWALAKTIIFNNCSRSLYELQQEALAKLCKGQILPLETRQKFSIVGTIKCNIHIYDQFNNKTNSLFHVKRGDFEILKTNNTFIDIKK